MAAVEVEFDFTIRDRDTTVWAPTQFLFPASEFPETIEELTDRATNYILAKLDSRSCVYLPLESAMHSKVVIKCEEVISVHVRAPETMPEPVYVQIDEDEDDE